MLKIALIAAAFFLVSACGYLAGPIQMAPSGSAPRTEPNFSTEVGAGGSGVLCDGKGTAKPYFEVLDVYEARKRGMGPDLGPANLPVLAKIDIALNRLAVFSPLRAARYRKRAADILAHATYFKKGRMPHIGDDDPSDLEEGCRLVQIATRKKPIFKTDPEFLIDFRYFQQLDNDNQAVIALHETAYEEAFQYGQRTSRFSRGFISTFFSRHIETMTYRDFVSFLALVEFQFTDYGGLQVPTQIAAEDNEEPGTLRFSGDEAVSAGYTITTNHGDISVPTQNFDYFGKTLTLGGGTYQEASFSKGHLVALYGYLYQPQSRQDADGAELILLEDRGNQLALPVIRSRSLTVFDEAGRFQLVTVGKGSKIRKSVDEIQVIGKLSCVQFDSNGIAQTITEHYCSFGDTKTTLPKHWQ